MPAVAEREEFLVFVNRSRIHRYVFDRSQDELVPINGPTNILAVDYDYANDCVFWSDARLYNIQVNFLVHVQVTLETHQEGHLGCNFILMHKNESAEVYYSCLAFGV